MSEFVISHTFQRKCYISIARTGNFYDVCVRSLFTKTILNHSQQPESIYLTSFSEAIALARFNCELNP